MISATGRRATHFLQRAFSLLEVLITLSIIVIIAALATVNFKGVNREREIVTPILEIQKLSKHASRAAATGHTPFVLKVMPLSVISHTLTPEGSLVPSKSVYIPSSAIFSIKPFGMTKWITPEKEGYMWFFEPSGLCEPLSMKLEMDKSFYLVTFDPLTGGVADEQMIIQQ